MPQFEYHNNTCGIARFRAKVGVGEIGDLSMCGMIDEVNYLGVGRYSVHLVAPLNTGELYQPNFTAPVGFLTGSESQNESSFEVGLTDLSGNRVDCDEFMTVSFNRLTEAIE